MTVASALAVGIMRLRSEQAAQEVRDSARADAQLLLGEVLGADRAWMLAHGDDELTSEKLDAFGLLLDERMRGIPIAYLMHSVGFFGRAFYVDERVLVPRPESEHIVEAALAHLRKSQLSSTLRALDIGTGSGALAITLALEFRELSVVATDLSDAALDVARSNATTQGVSRRVEFIRCDLADGVDGRFDCIVANLPYLASREIPLPPNPVSFEPQAALDGGRDGLEVYRRLLNRLGELVRPQAAVIMEASPRSIYSLAQLVQQALPGAHIDVGSDYAGLERFIVASMA
jgi:release factor glutamine methyltransferase